MVSTSHPPYRRLVATSTLKVFAVLLEYGAYHSTTATDPEIARLGADTVDGPVMGTCDVPHTGGWDRWQEVTCPANAEAGTHALYLCFRQRDTDNSRHQICNLERFRFASTA
ncbi:carbohydrate-binding protein [Verrucomicrobiota bacterium]